MVYFGATSLSRSDPTHGNNTVHSSLPIDRQFKSEYLPERKWEYTNTKLHTIGNKATVVILSSFTMFSWFLRGTEGQYFNSVKNVHL